ncbi:hypothetical protein BZG36_00724 [Bifiguratus adelaidae]|uniref:alpha,alpha-trehalase n=1 Tax=Bifiguratus adelaidae TaxID=1938954 RepID=A0A261Y6T5_9FUNG|nr:hypothetical protein BZG36_00724 [Bifiguratus adelaidae]
MTPSASRLVACLLCLASVSAFPLPALLKHGWWVSSSDSWVLSTNVINTTAFESEPYVANGYIGARLPVEGVGLKVFPAVNYTAMDGTQGWPLFSLRQTASIVAGFYDEQGPTRGTNFAQTGGEQVISLLPTWSSLFVTVSEAGANNASSSATYGVGVDLSQIVAYKQSLSLRNGIVTTSVTWSPFGSNSGGNIDLVYTVLAHRSNPNLGLVRLDVSGLSEGQQVVFTDVLDGAGAQRVENEMAGYLNATDLQAIYSAVSPIGVPNVTAWEISAFDLISGSNNITIDSVPAGVHLSSNASTAARAYSLTAPSDGKISVYKAVGIASSDAFPGVERATALSAAQQAVKEGWDAVVASHKQAWEDLWTEGGEIIINGAGGSNDPTGMLSELQKTSRASIFHLLSNIRNGTEGPGLGDNSIAPAGLTSDSYAGGIFWDAETWMYPSLLALYPDYAMSINNYRSKNLAAAKENVLQYNRSGLLYPWISFRYGNCTGIGPCYDYEYHLNNDIALAQWQYFLSTNNNTWLADQGYPIMSAVSEFWASQVTYNETTGKYQTRNETDPDEYANFQNDAAFTDAGVAVTLRNTIQAASILGKSSSVPSNWSDIANNIVILYQNTSNIVLEYEGFNASTPVKQADVVLLIYPLEYNVIDPTLDLTFYAGATSPNGPGMTYSIFSIDAAQLATQGCESYTYLLQSSEPYVRAPFAQFSEQTVDNYEDNGHTNPAYTFLTGHGGYLQTYTHGFTGYRPRLDCFYLDPSLPPQFGPEGYTVKGMKWQGNVFDVTVGGKETTVTLRSSASSKACVEIGTRNKNQGKHNLSVGKTLKVETYRADLNGTLVPGNKAQCPLVVSSNSTIMPGQYDIGAVDGSNATYWRPGTTAPASIIIDLGKEEEITALHFNFNNNPPTSYTVWASKDNSTSSTGWTQIAKVDNVPITAPYDPSTASEVLVHLGNTSDVTLSKATTARYVQLVVEGAQTDDGSGDGATVAEVAVI